MKDIEHIFFQRQLVEESRLLSSFSHLLGMLHNSATAILECMMELPVADSFGLPTCYGASE